MNKQQSLFERFMEFNGTKRLAGPKKYTLLAVSGGMDSVVMLDLFSKAKFPCAVIHCNFQLRGEEANADEAFVYKLAEQYNMRFYVKRFDTTAYAEEFKVSIQVAARELRYKWFEEMRIKQRMNLVATAHHLNDNIETILYNFTKGTGLRGLRGIPERQGNIIRPLLFATRQEIAQYCTENNLRYREDSSNANDKYTRNKIRHHVIPLLKEINPSLEKTIGEKVELLNEIEKIYEARQKKVNKQLFLLRGSDVYIPLLKLKKTPHASSILYEYLKDFGFTASQVQDMLSVIDEPAGKQFITNSARVIKDRRFFILTQLPERNVTVKLIHEKDEVIEFGNCKLRITNCDWKEASDIRHPSTDLEYIDKSKLEFPLLLRTWKEGDYFYPIGMGMKKKKVKKFLTDLKVPLHEKEKVLVLESNQKIVWVVGYRLDERFKVNSSSVNVAKISCK
jgi:tRNA(Ile)-lysidine synthase